MNRKSCGAIIFVVVMSLAGCAHIPKESAQLSAELTGMIKSAQTVHLNLIDGYVNERRARVDDFMKDKWIPTFLERFVNGSGVLVKIDKAGSPSEKGKIMLEFSEAAMKEIYARRTAQVAALDDIERAMKDEVGAHYADMLTVNQAITAHLMSAAKVTEAREELLNQLKVNPKNIIPIQKINDIMDKIVRYEGKLDELPNYIDEAKKLIRKEK